MTATGFAVFAFVAFLLPVPLLHWLDRPKPRRTGSAPDGMGE